MERLGEQAQQVLDAATGEALHQSHSYVGTEHLLLGLLTVDSAARDTLLAVGATADGARAKVVEVAGDADPRFRGVPELSARARRAMDRASRLSLQRRDPQVEPDHVLIGVLDVEGRAGQVLRGLGVDVAGLLHRLKLQVVTPALTTAAPRSPADAIAPTQHCPHCGTDMAAVAMVCRLLAAASPLGESRQLLVASCGACGSVLGVTAAP